MRIIKKKYNIVVAGGGIAGISAALKAAGYGADVLLIEHYGFTGGMSTAGMVSPFMKYSVGSQPLVQGVFNALEEEMRSMGGMIDNGFYASSFRSAACRLLKYSGCNVMLSSDIYSVNIKNGLIVSVDAVSYGIKYNISADVFIDTTGDAQLTYLAGLPCR